MSFLSLGKEARNNNIYAKYFLVSLSQHENVKVPLRRCSKVTDKYWCSVDWFWSVLYCAVNSSSHFMKDGQEDKPCSKEFMKQVFPKLRRPGTSPTNRSIRVYTIKSRKTWVFSVISVVLGFKIILKLNYLPLFGTYSPWKLEDPATASCKVFIYMVVSETYAPVKSFKMFLEKYSFFLDRNRFLSTTLRLRIISKLLYKL